MARTAFGRPLRSVAFDVAISLGVALSALAAVKTQPGSWGLTSIGLAMAVAVLFRRTRPTAAAIAVGLLALLQTLLGWHSQAFDVAVLVVMYSVVKYADRLRDGILAAGAVVVGIGLDARIPEGPRLPNAVFETLVSGAVWLVALNLRTRRLYVRSLEERAATLERERDAQSRAAVAEERTRIARELHDVVAHSLAVMIVQADGAMYTLDRDPDTARGAIKTVAETGRQALEEMRRLVGVLRDTTPAEPTGTQVPATAQDEAAQDEAARAIGGDQQRQRPALESLGALLDRSRAAGLVVRHEVHGEWAALPTGMDLTIYRIVQECLTNALKHAGTGSCVELTLDYSTAGEVGVRVVDDGRGTVVGGPPPSGGHGLVGMRERVAVYGGTYHAGPRLAGGWEVAVCLPIPSTRPQHQGV
ncbi:two-component sensor histidine kinase [Planosporangium flavigriseum]|uniref:histidine kinase n=1 Tax=Planosporangium flavigriseum TaxID=373681 RepID=A0A8J3PNC5_9ACTN|nr:histidine kinase [Planosporangium flavigriseum]NJC67234.1 two-component sensor histidine kinase [Planosporangium flavigriseum]GIG75199.1 two-component sensor histidine kinase [Planosporangium flavigriseum]